MIGSDYTKSNSQIKAFPVRSTQKSNTEKEKKYKSYSLKVLQLQRRLSERHLCRKWMYSFPSDISQAVSSLFLAPALEKPNPVYTIDKLEGKTNRTCILLGLGLRINPQCILCSTSDHMRNFIITSYHLLVGGYRLVNDLELRTVVNKLRCKKHPSAHVTVRYELVSITQLSDKSKINLALFERPPDVLEEMLCNYPCVCEHDYYGHDFGESAIARKSPCQEEGCNCRNYELLCPDCKKVLDVTDFTDHICIICGRCAHNGHHQTHLYKPIKNAIKKH